ncbi:unnamed protein product [Candida verbasci]|uniref:Glucose starvation modulator protein 1 n=1 Tax=Candida verbasci TaxID=1227364 RepID=A0A9W4TU80_9ASCO|nr:unnamed protein product [Candida verbasci]
MTKKLSLEEKKNRRPTVRACVFCHQKHLQCSNERPCKNCVKRNIANDCKDVERKKVKYLTGESSQLRKKVKIKPESLTSTPGNDESNSSSIINTPNEFNDKQINDILEVPPLPTLNEDNNNILNTTNDVLNNILSENYNSNVPLNQSNSNNFHSNYLNQEYLMLGDILLQSKPTSPSPSNTSASEHNTFSPNHHNFNLDSINQSKKKVIQKLKDSRPFISLGFSKDSSLSLNNLNNMYNQTDNLLDNNLKIQKNVSGKSNPIINFDTHYQDTYVNPLKTHQIYQTVSDIYNNIIINFEYPNSYHALTHFLRNRFSGNNLSPEEKAQKRNSLLIILKLIASYRPTFISAHKSLLKPQDLLFLEMSFQRCLIDYEKLCQLNSSPTIIWRRTGEIVSITDDLLSLLGYTLSDILSKRTFIMEMMYDDESIINYFQLFKSIAIGNLHSSINTKIKLMKKNDSNFIEFSSVWTVKRDLFDIPMLIIGQFLPILPAGDGVRMY